MCTPTSAHAEVAEALLAAGLDVLIEKPIAATTEEAGRLVDLAARQRPHPANRASGAIQPGGNRRREPILNHPMFFEAHRLSVFSPRSLDVDVVLDLMIHDLDIVLSLVRSPIRSLHAVGLPILSAEGRYRQRAHRV